MHRNKLPPIEPGCPSDGMDPFFMNWEATKDEAQRAFHVVLVANYWGMSVVETILAADMLRSYVIDGKLPALPLDPNAKRVPHLRAVTDQPGGAA